MFSLNCNLHRNNRQKHRYLKKKLTKNKYLLNLNKIISNYLIKDEDVLQNCSTQNVCYENNGCERMNERMNDCEIANR